MKPYGQKKRHRYVPAARSRPRPLRARGPMDRAIARSDKKAERQRGRRDVRAEVADVCD